MSKRRTRFTIVVKTLQRAHQVSARRWDELRRCGLIVAETQPDGSVSKRCARVAAGVYAWLSDEGVLEFYDGRRPTVALIVLRMNLNCFQLERFAPRTLDRTQLAASDPPGLERHLNLIPSL
jgi:hypothetical protein